MSLRAVCVPYKYFLKKIILKNHFLRQMLSEEFSSFRERYIEGKKGSLSLLHTTRADLTLIKKPGSFTCISRRRHRESDRDDCPIAMESLSTATRLCFRTVPVVAVAGVRRIDLVVCRPIRRIFLCKPCLGTRFAACSEVYRVELWPDDGG